MSVRAEVEAKFREDWSDIPVLADFTVMATERELDAVNTPTALLRIRGITKTPQAPLSHRNVSMWLTLISPHEDPDRAADDLDAFGPAVLDYLDFRFQHEDAEVVGIANRLALNIPFAVMSKKE